MHWPKSNESMKFGSSSFCAFAMLVWLYDIVIATVVIIATIAILNIVFEFITILLTFDIKAIEGQVSYTKFN